MKLFKSLLVAPATLGLLAPMSATANEITINDFNPVVEETLLAGGEGLVDDHSHDGGFSETTTASFSADFAIGSVDGTGISTGVTDGDEALEAYYGFQIDLSTSFTGEDSLDISIDAGNSGGAATELDLNGPSESLTVDGVSYTFPVGDKVTAFVGDNTDGSALYSTACVYGGPSNTLDDCGNASSALAAGFGTAAGASFEIGNGFTAAVGYEGQGSGTTGLLTKEGADAFGAQLTYTADSYGASVTYANIESTTTAGAVIAGEDVTYWALNGYWTPSEAGSMPSISVGYEMGDPEKAGAKDTTQYFVGLQWDEIGPGTFGVALGTDGAFAEDATEYMMYEAFYSYPVNDGMTITPLIYVRENDATNEDQTGILVKTSFSF